MPIQPIPISTRGKKQNSKPIISKISDKTKKNAKRLNNNKTGTKTGTKILAFNWDNSKKKEIQYFLCDKVTLKQDIEFRSVKTETQSEAEKVIDSLYDEIQNIVPIEKLDIKCKIFFRNPTQNPKFARNSQLSEGIDNYFRIKFKYSNIQPRRTKLKRDQSKKLKGALSNWNLLKKGSVAYHIHLWSYVFEITNGNLKDTLQKLWKIKNNINRMSPVTKQQFQEWYDKLTEFKK